MLHPSQGFLKSGSWHSWGFPDGPVERNLPANAGDTGDASSISGLGRFPDLGNGNALQHFCLESPRDRAAWQAAVHPPQSWVKLSSHSLSRGRTASESPSMMIKKKKKNSQALRLWRWHWGSEFVSSWPDFPTHQCPGHLPSALSVKARLALRVLLLSCWLERPSSSSWLRSFSAHYCWLLASRLPGFALWLQVEKRSCGLLWAPPFPSPSTDFKNKGAGFCILPLSYVVRDKWTQSIRIPGPASTSHPLILYRTGCHFSYISGPLFKYLDRKKKIAITVIESYPLQRISEEIKEGRKQIEMLELGNMYEKSNMR